MRQFNNMTAGDNPQDLYNDLGAEEGVNPQAQPIHCFGGSASLTAAQASSVTCTPTGMTIRPDRIEFSAASGALATVTGLTVGGMPIMHGGSMPGDCFTPTAVAGLRPGVAASPNNPLVVSLTSLDTATRTYVIGVKGPCMRA